MTNVFGGVFAEDGCQHSKHNSDEESADTDRHEGETDHNVDIPGLVIYPCQFTLQSWDKYTV